MKMVPLFRVDEMAEALAFYTSILDFELWGLSPDDLVASLVRGEAELMLTALPTDQAAQVNALLIVDDADALWAVWSARGLDQTHLTDSPVHLGPLDQSWGTREFYVTDPFGNTLRIVQRR